MCVCLCHVETIACNQILFTNFAFVCSKEEWYRNTYLAIDYPIHGEHGKNYSSALQSVCKFQPFLQAPVLYKSIFLSLLLRRAVTSNVIGI